MSKETTNSTDALERAAVIHRARELLEANRRLTSSSGVNWAGIALTREAVELLSLALARHRGLEPASYASDSAWDVIQREPDVERYLERLPEDRRQQLGAAWRLDEGVGVVAHEGDAAVALQRTLTELASFLLGTLDVRDPKTPNGRRRRLQQLAAGLAMTALAFGTAWYQRPSHSNLALDRAVRLSSYDLQHGIPPTALVDGDRHRLGCQTKDEERPWAQIDLGDVHLVNRVVVSGPRDNDAVHSPWPLVVQLSNDGTSFLDFSSNTRAVATWTAIGQPSRARYVRITLQGQGVLRLNEVEID